MTNDYHRKGRNYELFIRKVFNCKKGKKYGADQSYIINLFLYEIDGVNRNQRIPIKRQFFKVKLYIEIALIKLKKKKEYINSIKHFSPLQIKLSSAKTPDDLAKIVSASLSKIITLENELKNRNK